MRIATFNVESLFERPLVMDLDDWSIGAKVLADYSRLNDLIGQKSYSEDDKNELLQIMSTHKGLINNEKSTYLRLRVIRGKFLSRTKPPAVVANGRGDWIGWFELVTETVTELATENTARVIHELQPDVLCVVEAEDRIALKHFNTTALPRVQDKPFEHVMLIDGNDDRGIDVGILVRAPYEIKQISSHVDDRDEKGVIFSRDCAEYVITSTESEEEVLLLLNHFKSKGYGAGETSDEKRKRQAERVRDIYQERLQQGYKYIAVAGDLNDTPGSEAISTLLAVGLVDIMSHPNFTGDGRPGTYGNGTESGKFDYILMSPELAAKVTAGGIERRGVWGGKHGTLFPHFPEVHNATEAASDHAALWAEVSI